MPIEIYTCCDILLADGTRCPARAPGPHLPAGWTELLTTTPPLPYVHDGHHGTHHGTLAPQQASAVSCPVHALPRRFALGDGAALGLQIEGQSYAIVDVATAATRSDMRVQGRR